MREEACHYSGKLSKRFWNRVNRLKEHKNEAYACGVLLQNMESMVLLWLRNAEAIESNQKSKLIRG